MDRVQELVFHMHVLVEGDPVSEVSADKNIAYQMLLTCQ